MDKIRKVINSPLFRSAAAGSVGAFLIIEGNILYAGIALGIAIREFLLAFKEVKE